MDLFEKKHEILKTVLASFGKTEKNLLTDVEILKKWMKTQLHLPEILEDDYIKNLLLLNECNLETTKKKIDLYYTIRTIIPDFYESINPKSPNMKELMDITYFTPLPKLTPEMHRVLVFNIHNAAMIDQLKPKDIMRQYMNIQELRMKEDVMSDEIIIGDMAGINMEFVKQLTVPFIIKSFFIVEHLYSFSLKGLYFVNASPIFDIVMTILQRVLKPKFFERMHICRDLSLLYQHVPKEILPKDYGGQEKSVGELQGLLKVQYNKHKSRFDHLDTLKVDENLRTEKFKFDKNLSFNGDFKQLNID